MWEKAALATQTCSDNCTYNGYSVVYTGRTKHNSCPHDWLRKARAAASQVNRVYTLKTLKTARCTTTPPALDTNARGMRQLRRDATPTGKVRGCATLWA